MVKINRIPDQEHMKILIQDLFQLDLSMVFQNQQKEENSLILHQDLENIIIKHFWTMVVRVLLFLVKNKIINLEFQILLVQVITVQIIQCQKLTVGKLVLLLKEEVELQIWIKLQDPAIMIVDSNGNKVKVLKLVQVYEDIIQVINICQDQVHIT